MAIRFVCSRCGGEGQWQRRGTCYSCGGKGYHEYKSANQANRYVNNTGQEWNPSFLMRAVVQREQQTEQEYLLAQRKEKQVQEIIKKKKVIRRALNFFWEVDATGQSTYDIYMSYVPKLEKRFGKPIRVPTYVERDVWRKAIDGFNFNQFAAAGSLCSRVLEVTNDINLEENQDND